MRKFGRWMGVCALLLTAGACEDDDIEMAHDAGSYGDGDGDVGEPDAGDGDVGDGDAAVGDAGSAGDGDGDGDMDASVGMDGAVADSGPGGDGDAADAAIDAGPIVWPTNGLRADYYDEKSFVVWRLKQVDPTIDFSWPKGVVPDPRIKTGNGRYSVRWLGEVQPNFDGDYTFTVDSDDGVKIWFDDPEDPNDQLEPAINDINEVGNPPLTFTRTNLKAAKRYGLRVEYFNGADAGHIKLEWESGESVPREVIPTSQLFPADMDATWDIGACRATVEIEGDLYASDPDPRQPGCNSFEAEESEDNARHVSTGNIYQHIVGQDYTFYDCGPCSPANYGGGYGGRNIRFNVPTEAGNPRPTVTMKIPRETAGTYRLKFWFALERASLSDPPVAVTVNINNALEQPLEIHPTLVRTSSTVNDGYEMVADLIAGDNTVVITGPDFGASPDDKDALRFDRVTVEKLDGTTGP